MMNSFKSTNSISANLRFKLLRIKLQEQSRHGVLSDSILKEKSVLKSYHSNLELLSVSSSINAVVDLSLQEVAHIKKG
ncbi:hypothetical protein BpHYR1_007548 [Brachionus plicatilis]|uniref:Uncharacterized protein n=1 Tax=Brachionus plicatilis TaxID=10195 RepID=A0A3M7S1L0_BRAPC|nr:hypothetical protein BpHYR1_007548 [Brachionus plicatilis]